MLRTEIVLRVAPTLREEIERAASTEGRSLANMTRRILERWMPQARARLFNISEINKNANLTRWRRVRDQQPKSGNIWL